jgi:hypothetical protein
MELESAARSTAPAQRSACGPFAGIPIPRRVACVDDVAPLPSLRRGTPIHRRRRVLFLFFTTATAADPSRFVAL